MINVVGFVGRWWKIAVGLVLIGTVGYLMYNCGRHRQDDEVAALTTKLISSGETVEIQKGLFAKKTEEVEGLKDLLAKLGAENSELADVVKKGQMDVIALNEIVVKWRKAYEAAVKASQTDVPPIVQGDPPRKRVDFNGHVGPISVEGHTLTDPPEAILKWQQVDPLRITVAITKNRDGTYSTLVDTDNDDIVVDVKNAVLDLSSLRPTWRQRIWVDGEVGFLLGREASLGASYHLDRFSIGARCSAWEDGHACGLSFGYRIFK